MKIPTAKIQGINYIDCEHVDITKRESCPLQDCGLGHLCVNEYQDPRYRSEHCDHQEFCQDIKNLHTGKS